MIRKMNQVMHKEITILGPLFVLCAFALSLKTAISLDLLVIGALGLYLSATLKLRGCIYALFFLLVGASVKHFFFTKDHLFQLGIESSFACAFFITALGFEEGASLFDSLKSQMQTKESTLENLEEELEKAKQELQEQQIAFQEKVAFLKKELEELTTDHSSILILNEVLRKNAARFLQEQEAHAALLSGTKKELEQIRLQYQEMQKDLILNNQEALVVQNKELMKELNAARFAKEQASHMPVKEQDPQLLERLQFAEERMAHFAQIEPLYKQLKKQFQEKNQILHEVRSELFRSNTELEKMKIEQASLEVNLLPKELEKEMDGLVRYIQEVEEENEELQDLVSVLSDLSQESPKRKKKVKIQSQFEQELLF
jgi:hypothetical protein